MSFIHNKLFILSTKKNNNIVNKKIIKCINENELDNTYTNTNTNTNTDTNNEIVDDIIIITKNNFDLLKKDFVNINSVRIFGKGQSFQNIKKKSKSEFNIGINQTVNELTHCDMLVINDLHNIFLIKDEVFKKIRYILTPEYLHINGCFNKDGHFKKVYDYLKEKNFVGKYIVFNLRSNLNINPEYIYLPSLISSCNNANDFVCFFLKEYIKQIDFYGVGIYFDKIYNEKFVGNGIYNNYAINKIKYNIEKTCDENKIKYNFY